MKTWIYSEILSRVQTELDLTNETFIQPDEYVAYCNEALEEAEAEIHKLNEEYFLTSASLTLVQSQAAYSVPTDLYGQKIRNIDYINGALVYPVRRIRGDKKFYDIALTNQFGQSMEYRWFMTNPSVASGFQINIVPPPREAGALMTVWYLRNATRVPTIASGSQAATYASKIDIPEFANFIVQWMKVRCLEKEGDPRVPFESTILEEQRKMMVDTLTQATPDDDDCILPDLSHYSEHE